MKRALLTLALAALPQAVLAQPPVAGETHTFYDPIYEGTVFCDTLDQLRAIAAAAVPRDVFLSYAAIQNAQNEPTCAAIVTTGTILAVTPLGEIEQDGMHFNAWGVETKVGEVTAYGLYLEEFREVIA